MAPIKAALNSLRLLKLRETFNYTEMLKSIIVIEIYCYNSI